MVQDWHQREHWSNGEWAYGYHYQIWFKENRVGMCEKNYEYKLAINELFIEKIERLFWKPL